MTAESSQTPSWLVFDIESVPDPGLISLVRTHGEKEPEIALQEFREEKISQKNSDFIPYVYQTPISLALAKVNADFSLMDLVVLKVEDGGPGEICRRFWRGWEHYRYPQIVSFNGRRFDIPLLELTAYRYGIPIKEWLVGSDNGKARRARFSGSHLDLLDALTNYGASTFEGGLDLAAKLIRKPGKLDIRGDMVWDMFRGNQLEEIHRYCRCDVLDTYFVFLRYHLIKGEITKDQERDLVEKTYAFLDSRSDEEPVYREYLAARRRVEEYLDRHGLFKKYEKQTLSSK